jgi:nucleotide-binding universal stress UspA family protein
MKVLLAFDGSDDARAAAESLAQFPLPEPTALLVVSVVTLPHAAVDIPQVREFNETLREHARRIVDEARALLAPRFGDAEGWVREGDPRAELIAAAEQWHPDLIVIGARGLGAFKGFLLGSVSTTIVRRAACPVLVVKRTISALRSLVVAIDGSANSLAAARFVAGLPLHRGSRVRLLGVVEPPLYPPSTVEMPSAALIAAFEEDARRRREELRGVLAGLEAPLHGKGPVVESAAVIGSPGREILAAANEPGVDLVVVGARGLGPMKRLVLGSVSERVLQHAPCSVLIVKS